MDDEVESSVNKTDSQSENAHPTARKRFRREESEGSSDSDSDYTPYVPLKERRKQQLGRLGRLHAILLEEKRDKSSTATDEDDEQRDEYGRKSNISLLDQHTELKKKAEARKESALEKQLKEEEKNLGECS
ncbi:hypothetical protein MRX96_006971 [Rhipicephalus microplus]